MRQLLYTRDMLHRFPLFLTGIGLFVLTAWVGFSVAPPNAVAPSSQTGLPASDEREHPASGTAIITMVGDMMLAREVEREILAQGPDWPFAAIKDEWADSDLVIGNFESTIRDAYRYEGEILAFDTTPSAVVGLKNAGFTHLSLANNHGDDFGAAVTEYTRSVIADLGLTPFGDPVESELYIAHADANGLAVSLVGFHAFIEDPAVIAAAIEREAVQGYFVIVMPHWGPEYQTYPSLAQTSAAQLFVDAGADLIVGAHPHVIQTIDSVDGVPVAYSLGNFVFDQDWSVPTQQGMMLQITITDTTITLTPVAVDVLHRQASLGSFTVPAPLTFARP